MNNLKIFVLVIFGISVGAQLGCNSDENNLQEECVSAFEDLIQSLGFSRNDIVRDSLIACAASGTLGILSGTDESATSILFYPNGQVSDFRYWVMSDEPHYDPDADCFPYDRHVFQEALSNNPLWNGYLRKFKSWEEGQLGFVSYIKDDKVYISNPIQIKTASQPTAFNPSDVQISDTDEGKRFEWQPSPEGEDVIYFHVVADLQGNLISGTYTTDRHWTFYDLSNVVLNIRDVDPPPTLTESETYQFVVMAVSEDNWVNALWDTTFVY